MTQSHGLRRPPHLIAIVAALAVAGAVAGCAPSPLYTGQVKRFAPGGIPRDQFGQPVFEKPRSARHGFLGVGRRKAVPAPVEARPAGAPIIYYQDLHYSERPSESVAVMSVPGR